jgi:hypothetical protein
METMILVAGLAVAGLVGIAAAFYFSIRSGHGGDKRLRAASAGRARTDRRQGSRSNGPAGPDRTDNARRTSDAGRSLHSGRAPDAASRNYRAEASTGPNPVPDFGDPVLAGSRRRADSRAGGRSGERAGVRRPGDRPEPQEDAWPDEPWLEEDGSSDAQATDPRLGSAKPGESRPGSRAVARLSREAHAAGHTAKTDRPRRRVGFRKGADLDEELWPAEAFGGISDEQFWDDLASDKPLTTTARTAQQEPGPRKRPLDAAPAADRQPARAKAEDRSRSLGEDRSRSLGEDRSRGQERSLGEDRRGAGYGAYPESRTRPNPAAERTAVQPATQPVRPSTQPAETRGHRRRSAEEDPLTSSAFALRASGPVDGRSALRSRDSSAGGGTPSYLYPGGSYGDASAVTQAMNTPPYGENYGYGGGSAAGRGADPRRPNGTRNQAPQAPQAPQAGAGEGTRPARAYPQDGYQATGSYRGKGSYQGNGNYPTGGYPPGGYRGNGHQGNGHRAPYDPRDDYRWLIHLH